MKKSILALALLSSMGAAAGFSTSASAAVGNPFLRFPDHKGSPERIAAAIEASLPRDKTGYGRAIIDPALCRQNGSCSTAEDYVDQLQVADPDGAPKEASLLPAFFRSLVEVETSPNDVYWMSCLVSDGHGGWTPKAKCLKRNFLPGEKAYMDPKTHKIIVAGDCSNPIEFKVEDCLYINIGVDAGQELHGFRLNEASPRDKCGPMLLLEGTSVYVTPTDDCPRVNCTAVRPAHYLGDVAIKDDETFSFKAKVTGRYILRVSPEDLNTHGIWLFCLYDPRTGIQSQGETIFGMTWDTTIGQTGQKPHHSYYQSWAYISHQGSTKSTPAWRASGGRERIWTNEVNGQPF
jgi:hypothetical protein